MACTWTPILRADLSGTKNTQEWNFYGLPVRSGTYPAGTPWQWVDIDTNTFGALTCCVQYCPEP